jgi:general stress protein CsbA
MADIVAVPAETRGSYVEWAAIIAGAIVASALSFVLLTAGAAIGLSLVSPYAGRSASGFAATMAAFWLIFVPILSLLIGGYIAGRMRSAVDKGVGSDEVDFRDGIHGLLVWAVSILLGGMLAYFAASTAAQTTAQLGSAAANQSSTLAPSVDTMLRGVTGKSGTGQPLDNETRADITRTIAGAVAAGQLSAGDRTYLAQVVAQRTGLAQPEAEKRVDDAFASALKAIDTARKAAVATGLGTVTALLFGMAAAWYAAQRGGRHRDESVPARFGFGSPASRLGRMP